MMLRHLPLTRPKPDATEFIDILMGRSQSRRVPLIEYIVDDFLIEPIMKNLLGRKWIPFSRQREALQAYFDNFIEFWWRMGYDFVRYEEGLPFSERNVSVPDVVAGANKSRIWVDLHQGSIATWNDFEQYHWPEIEEMDFFPFEYLNKHLPEGMGFITCHGAGILERLSNIMSYEGLSLALYDQPALVQAVVDRIGELLLAFYRHLLDLENVIVIFQGDDMGFRSGTLISPDDLRKYVLPWHQKLAALVHAHSRPYFLHSCGNVEAIMEDLIAKVGIDGKHSYEDAILPVQEFQARFGEKIAVSKNPLAD